MKKNICVLAILTIISSSAFSYAFEGVPQELIDSGLPLPDGGIKVISRYDFADKSRIKNDMKMYEEQQTQGFINKNSEKAKNLLQQKYLLPAELTKTALIDEPRSTHLRSDSSAVKFGFNFPKITINVTKIWGFAPAGTYVDDAWTGGVQLFESKIGSCSLLVNAIKLSHASTHIAKEVVKYDVNNKVTTEFVTGNDTSGYLYTVSWFDDTYFRDLECANKNYSENILKQIIDMAVDSDSRTN